uniref:Uncharacterized protein n=1 Tax=Trichogramma kaykai TaxID=54128 RepID=A0ABD2X1Q8_9HYME
MLLRMPTSCENSRQSRRCRIRSEAAFKTSDAALPDDLAAKALKLGHILAGSTAASVVARMLHAVAAAGAPATSRPAVKDLIAQLTASAADKQAIG